ARLRHVLFNQNMHECENKFTIKTEQKIYDAIYIAQARRFKRMHLAQSVRELYILTYGCGVYTNSDGENDLAKFEPKVAHASWNKRFTHDRGEVSRLICMAYAGLALSAREG